jgi:hypothetical protein
MDDMAFLPDLFGSMLPVSRHVCAVERSVQSFCTAPSREPSQSLAAA